ncbi:MAG TPA: methylmalonyl-CoA mutase small subunit [Tenuifilaceae bacterium]|nr:methylmalonyl-CoA mutase small subunit [Tenuifilaceae bacterium]
MAEKSNEEKLFTEFPPVSTADWEAAIAKDLKGADYEKKLVWKTLEGFNVRPYYRSEDLKNIPTAQVKPGEFPYVRGKNINGNPWLIRQDFDVCLDQPTDANRKALELLNKGVESLGFKLSSDCEPTFDSVSRLLKDIDLNKIEINFTGGTATAKALPFIVKYLEQSKYDSKKIRMSIDYSPLSTLALKGKFCCENDANYVGLASVLNEAKNFPNARVIGANGAVFHNSGSSIVQELGFSLAMANDYLTALIDQGYSIDDVAPHIRFNFSVSSNYFMEIAKFRAARLLWAKLVDAYGAKQKVSKQMNIHAETSRWNMTVYDPYVNMLRSTTESMSAVLAGVDSLNVLPFDTAFSEPTAFSERIARNQQILLKEESYFGKIVDPAAGSYYVENLTVSIAERAWEIFLNVDEMGGFREAFVKGYIQQQITETANKRNKNIASKREILLGTNQYPNFTEVIDPKVEPEAIKGQTHQKPEDAIAEPLVAYRGAQAFEELRYNTDKSSHKPKVFMLSLGNLAMRRARAQFSCNFFAVAGFEVIDNIGFKTVDEGIKAALDAKSDIVVICSSDDEYASLAPEAFEKLNGKAIFVVAGDPACKSDLEAKGISNYINVKSNLLETLKQYQSMLNI